MRIKYAVIGVVVGVLLSATVVLAGSLEPPSWPTDPASQMYTLEQIYDRLDTGAAATKMTWFTEPLAGPGSTMHTLDDLYDLVGERAQVPKTGQTTSTGVAWPNPRFTDNSDGTVSDNLTGLIWVKNANCDGTKDGGNARSWANGLYDGCTNCGGTNNDCGLSDGSSAGDWRLPNVRELHSLIDFSRGHPALPSGHPFTAVLPDSYWSSTSYVGYPGGTWVVWLNDGEVRNGGPFGANLVWPVRGGQ